MDNCLNMASSAVNITKKLDREIASLIKEANSKNIFILYSYAENTTWNTFLSNPMLITHLIQQGLPYSFFDLIQEYSPFDTEDWLMLLAISSKTLSRYKEDGKSFKPILSEKIIEMAEVTHAGMEVFGNMEKFKLWLDTPNFSLGKMKPFDLLKDSYGKELVLTELTHINYGILA
jgi:putative toxin-antitoxin system antitoxin component (TIGR02293 family)